MTELAGCVVATTRADTPDDHLIDRLEEAGAAVVVWHTIAIEPPADAEAFRRVVEQVDRYDWVAFTSVRSVEAMTKYCGKAPTHARIVAVGVATARALESAGWVVAVTGTAGAEELVNRWSESYDLSGSRVLFPAGSRARSTLERQLGHLGAHVDRVEAYRTRLIPPDGNRVRADLANGVDIVTFASPSAVRSLAESLSGDWPEALVHSVAVTIGPTTSNALIASGFDPARIVTADPPGMDGLLRASISARTLTEFNDRKRAP